jgi:hypothetical protein
MDHKNNKNAQKLMRENKLLRQQAKLNSISDKNTKIEQPLVNRDIASRAALMGLIDKTHNQTRDLYKVFGYTKSPQVEDYIGRFMRQDIANRIVSAYPNACWGHLPKITDDQTEIDESEFEIQVNKLFKNKKVLSYIKRLDILAGLGHFGVLFIGVRDGKKESEPLEGNITSEDILFLAPYSEVNTSIESYDDNPQSERFGLPLMYNLETGGYGDGYSSTPSSIMPTRTFKVHHSRIIHVADGMLENDVMGTPRLEKVVNRLIDLEKITGGSAETFFLNARGGLHMNQDPDTNISDPTLLENRMEDFTNNLTRYLRTKGFDVSPLNFNVADPKNHFDVITSLISAATGIPRRILLGAEQGQLASTQDENNWLSRVMDRQIDFCEPIILRPIIDWCLRNGVLPEPIDNEYEIIWPDMRTVSDMEKADIAIKRTQALSQYTDAQGAELIMPPEQFFEDILSLEYKEDSLPDADDFDIVDGEE